MLPTLPADGSILVVSALAYWRPKWMGGNRRPERGDLVTFPSPSNPEYAVCKRVVGLPGDIVEVEPRRSDDDPGWLAGHVVERRGQGVFIKGHVWVAGDNMSNSIDSRHYGPVPIAMIRGKATYDVSVGGSDAAGVQPRTCTKATGPPYPRLLYILTSSRSLNVEVLSLSAEAAQWQQ
ncbi:signal peptidase I [Trichosporon asahii var. asahii CBS 2479]|uniref:Mitochondrial inner membrane protease subunit n=1 Tax=Trichosporon asahii var. asahii (strain ATCC 90039 / CBS 2479 / JCM 2466 / KCTC 7840 / NBRC 103889/ NCYC 2677 / UAMH 7654) TaxID=1186058 RepID=J6F4F4_TRIAS|nr:signal peptidase I [Trichosporon asahii var. asahii CBS 2479]EJT50132.1 signal peptidase I [Trichosporon asahii var. asahii CBS 2479]